MPSRICRKSWHLVRVAGLCLLFLFPHELLAQTPAPAQRSKACIPKKMSEDEIHMLGRMLHAVEDLGGGYYRTARSQYKGIVRDVDKGHFSPCFRWMAYDGYGQALTASHEKEKAIQALTRASEEAKLLTDAQQASTQEHLQAVEQMK